MKAVMEKCVFLLAAEEGSPLERRWGRFLSVLAHSQPINLAVKHVRVETSVAKNIEYDQR